jgi:hypothetical protein
MFQIKFVFLLFRNAINILMRFELKLTKLIFYNNLLISIVQDVLLMSCFNRCGAAKLQNSSETGKKESIMIYTKDGLSTAKFIELLQYSQESKCQFLSIIKPKTSIVNDHVMQVESVIRFLKVEEKVNVVPQSDGSEKLSYRFSVKVLVEDYYWIKQPSTTTTRYCKSEKVPSDIHNRVAEILND